MRTSEISRNRDDPTAVSLLECQAGRGLLPPRWQLRPRNASGASGRFYGGFAGSGTSGVLTRSAPPPVRGGRRVAACSRQRSGTPRAQLTWSPRPDPTRRSRSRHGLPRPDADRVVRTHGPSPRRHLGGGRLRAPAREATEGGGRRVGKAGSGESRSRSRPGSRYGPGGAAHAREGRPQQAHSRVAARADDLPRRAGGGRSGVLERRVPA